MLASSAGYEHIVTHRAVQTIDGGAVAALAPGSLGHLCGQGDVLAGIVVGMMELEAAQPASGRKPPKELIVLSHGIGRVEGAEQIPSIATQLEKMKVAVTLLCVPPPHSPTRQAGVHALHRHPLPPRRGIALQPDAAQGTGQAALAALAASTLRPALLPVADALATWTALTCRRGTARRVFSGALQLGPLGIPVHAYTHVKATSFPPMSRRSRLGSATRQVDRLVEYRQRTEGGEEVVPEEELLRAYAYGKDLLTVDDAQAEEFKLASQRELVFLAFLPRSQLSRHWVVAGAEMLLPDPASTPAASALGSLAEALHRQESVALCRYVARKNAAPALVALVPGAPPPLQAHGTPPPPPTAAPPTLYLVPLPFAEDMRDFHFPPLPSLPHQPSQAQQAAADELVRSLSLDTAAAGPAATPTTALPNPALLRLADTLVAKHSGAGIDVVPVPPQLAQELEPPPPLLAAASKPLEAFAEAFPMKHVGPSKRQRVEFRTADAGDFDEAGGGAGAGAVAAGSSGGGQLSRGQGGDTLAALAGQSVTSIGRLQPEENLSAMLQAGHDPATVLAQFMGVVEEVGAASAGVPKAAQALVFVRPISVQHGVPGPFNALLSRLRDQVQSGAPPPATAALWGRLRSAGVTPISRLELPQHAQSMPAQEAAAFFHSVEPTPSMPATEASAAPGSLPQEEDDDLDDLA